MVIVTDENGNPVRDPKGNPVMKWVQFEVHDVGTEGGSTTGTVFGFFSLGISDPLNQPIPKSERLPGQPPTYYWIFSPFQVTWNSSTAVGIEVTDPGANLQSCVWGTKAGTICSEGFVGR